MTVWCHLPTIFRRRFVLRIAVLVALCVAINTTQFFSAITQAAPGINQTLSFSGRLLNSSGGVVPDGYYNIQFKIYQDGDGQQAGNAGGTGGALKWTESYVNNNSSSGVQVSSGFFSVNLGSKTAFGSNVDWNQDTLWLSMNIAGSSAACTTFGTSPCTADGEMLPMKRITSTPYAMNAGMLGGKTANGFVQNQTASPQTGDFNISGTGTAATLQGNTSVIAPLFDSVGSSSTLSVGTANASTINIGTNDSAHTINIATGSTGSAQNITIGSKVGTSYVTLQGGSGGVKVNSSGGFVVHSNGSNYDMLALQDAGSATLTVGSNGVFNVSSVRTGTSRFSVSDSDAQVVVQYGTDFIAKSNATFGQGITIQGVTSYVSPLGANLQTAVNIPNRQLNAYNSILSFGIQGNSATTARAILIADARTFNHQATIGVLSPDETNIMGLSWSGSNSTAAVTSTGNSLALQGNGLNLLTATNNGGAANIGIGNGATNGYALDVTGDINSSTQYRIGGNAALSSTSLAFSGASTSSITAASGQSLGLSSSSNVTITAGGTTTATFGSGSLKVGSGSGSGQPVLLTLDRASSTPTATGSGFIGSMYYDTTKNAVQCYNGTSWGSCNVAPTTSVSLTPEYSGAVLQGSGSGTMTAGVCSDTLHINDGTSSQPTICGTNETYNFYDWTTTSGSNQSYNIFVNYLLPSNFTNFVAGSTSLMGRTDSSNSSVSYQVYRKSSSGGLSTCGSSVSVSTGLKSTWQKATASGSADPSACSFVAGDSLVVKVTASAQSSANAYVGNLNFAYSTP